ncbi:LacI family DNA-binding transcriptional regulator (plasmid) [Streptomyces sp. BI20]|uniref:LacI family DNA-binding transcriptional regulator n=1 Tax=Streptomyces sp. BI20 TaxID=3403460 RepID=UPI003C768C57
MRTVPAPRSGAPTLEDVARAAGVSRATVSRVVNGVRNVDTAIARAVRDAVAATGYVPNRAARALVTRRTDTLALVVSGAGPEDRDAEFAGRVLGDPFFGRVVSGVVRALRPRGLHPVLMFAESDEDRGRVLAHLTRGGADGALLVSTHARDPLPGMLAAAGVPAVLFARPPEGVALDHVDLRHHEGGALAAGRLRATGRSRLAVIAGPADVPASAERVAGFLAGAAEGGGGAGAGRVPAVVHADFTLAGGEEAMRRLLDASPDVDGVFAANDLMAQGACLVARERGLRVPRDVAVVGFDDSAAAGASRPRLTTVRQPVEDMAVAMVRLLLERIEGGGGAGEGGRGDAADRGPTASLFDPVLVVRDSA